MGRSWHRMLVSTVIALTVTAVGMLTCSCTTVRQTDTELRLTVYETLATFLSPIIAKYQSSYPEVRVMITVIGSEDMSYEDFVLKQNAELMSGSGPDLMYMDNVFNARQDIYKLIQSDAFACLDDFMEADLPYSDLNPVIQKAGEWSGRQFVLPLSYTVPAMLTTQHIADGWGGDLPLKISVDDWREKIDTYFANEFADRNLSSEPRVSRFRGTAKSIPDYYASYFNGSDENAVDLNVPVIVEMLNACADIYQREHRDSPEIYDVSGAPAALLGQSALFEYYGASYSFAQLFMDAMGIASVDTPKLAVLESETGGVRARIKHSVAINGNSSNQKNAWNFIKLLLSDEWLMDISVSMDAPVRTSLLEDCIQSFETDFRGREMTGGIICAKEIPEEIILQYEEILSLVDEAYFKTPCSQLTYEEILPYWEGQSSLEEQLTRLQSKLGIYCDE